MILKVFGAGDGLCLNPYALLVKLYKCPTRHLWEPGRGEGACIIPAHKNGMAYGVTPVTLVKKMGWGYPQENHNNNN